MTIKHKLSWWLAFKLPPLVLLYALVRCFSFYGDAGDHNYSETYKMLVKRFNIKESESL